MYLYFYLFLKSCALFLSKCPQVHSNLLASLLYKLQKSYTAMFVKSVKYFGRARWWCTVPFLQKTKT